MAEFHFVEDYERLVHSLMQKYPLDEAMSLAVGGNYEGTGNIAAEILVSVGGARDGMDVLDFGCGSGRVAHALAKRVALKNYFGTDIVEALLAYAKSKCPPHYQFMLNRKYGIPAPDNSFDLAYAFSVFTHLLQTETFIYMQDIYRTLRPGGRFVFSFLEFADDAQWPIFAGTVGAQRRQRSPHLNEFTDQSQIRAFARRIGFEVVDFVLGSEPRWQGQPLGQSVAILAKPV